MWQAVRCFFGLHTWGFYASLRDVHVWACEHCGQQRHAR